MFYRTPGVSLNDFLDFGNRNDSALLERAEGIIIIWHLRLHSRSPTRTISFLMYVIFLKSKGFNDFKYDMDMDMYNMVVMDMDVVDTKTNTKTKTNTMCFPRPNVYF